MCELERILSDAHVDYKRNIKLSTVSSFRIGGEADYMVLPDTAEKLVTTLRTLKNNGIRFAVVGNTSNVLFSDSRFEGAIVITKKIADISFEGNIAVCGCGAMLPVLSLRAAEFSLSGVEFACGIPATLGGAVFMNAGAHGGEMSDVIKKITVYDIGNDKLIGLSSSECGFSYRHSILADNPDWVCLGATIALSEGENEEIKAKMKGFSDKRKATQPLDKPSAGSFFKRPEGYFAARLIDECGLKGYRVGGACVSEKHAGFIVNLGGATCADVLALAEYVSERVFDMTGVRLEREVRVI
ncbi:MAG: UDP-N-acetylmuramate dehydrogenase [Clostridia bacterium]|nr:UDP-N-acetylmuramate dehydrogenase [Clostridia bacterium]